MNNNSSQQYFCICSAGSAFGPDLSYFHDPSCSLPRYFFLAQFVELSLFGFVAVILMIKLVRGEKGRLAKVALWSGLGSFFTWVLTLGIFVQNGAFEIAGFFLTCVLISCTIAALYLIDMQVAVLKGMEQLSDYLLFRRILWITTVACSAGCFSIGVAWLVLCQTFHHNNVAIAALCSILFWNTVYVVEVVFFCSRLIRQVRQMQGSAETQANSSAFKNWDALISRIQRLKMVMYVYYMVLASGVLPMLVLHLVLGSAPYGFAMFLVALQCPPILSCAVYMLGKASRRKARVLVSGGNNETPIMVGTGPINDQQT